MKKRFFILAALVALSVAGCSTTLATTTPSPVPPTQVPSPVVHQSISLPVFVSVYCPGGPTGYLASTCGYPYTVAGTTGIVVARYAPDGFTDSQGNVWTKDFCTGFNIDCIFHTQFTQPNLPGDLLTFPKNEGLEAFLFTYSETWDFVSGATGDYSQQNAALGAPNGGDYDANWTLPVEAKAGNLIVGWSDSNAVGKSLAKAGPGFQIEASDGLLAVEDMIAPVEGVYIGSLVWKNSDGTDSGGSHWLMGVAVYQRRKLSRNGE